MKRVHLIYFSPGGTTKRSVRRIAEGTGCRTVIEHDMMKPVNRKQELKFSEDDLVILGMMTATKLFGVPDEIFNCMQGSNTPIVGVVLYGNGYYGSSLKIMKKEVERRGFRMVAAGAFIGQSSFRSEIANARPDAKDQELQFRFGQNIRDILKKEEGYRIKSKLKVNWSKDNFLNRFKCFVGVLLPGYKVQLPHFMRKFEIDDKCIHCGKCESRCPVGAMDSENNHINRELCIGCAACVNGCSVNSITITSPSLNSMMDKLVVTRADRKEPELFF